MRSMHGPAVLAVLASAGTPPDELGAAILQTKRFTLRSHSEAEMSVLGKAYNLVTTAPDESAMLLDSVMLAKPASATTLSLAAVVADARGDFEEAIEMQEAALIVEPSATALQLGLADYYLKAGRFAPAQVTLERLVGSTAAPAAERKRAESLLQNELPKKMRLRAIDLLGEGNVRAVVPLLHALALRGANNLLLLGEQLISRCRMQTAQALVGVYEAMLGGENSGAMLVAARVARFFRDEKTAQRHLSRALQLSPPGANGSSGEMRAHVLSLQRRYHEAFAELRRHHAEKMANPKGRTPPPMVTLFKLEHDAAQLRYLLERGLLTQGVPAAKRAADAFEAGAEQLRSACANQRKATVAPAVGGGSSGGAGGGAGGKRRVTPTDMPECDPYAHDAGWGALDAETRRRVQLEINAPRRPLPFSEWRGRPALNLDCCDWAEVQRQYLAGEVVVLDGFVTDDALEELLRLGVESTNWNSVKAGGYLGAFTSDGFAPPVIAQLATDLEEAMPAVLRAHSLLMFWGFKHDTVRTRAYHGIKPHADTAAVNMNFWVTPDDANLDATRGGLVVYDKTSDFNDFEEVSKFNSYELGAAELGLDSSRILRRVPYAQNRAVLFSSGLFHATDTVDFRPGFETCRINYTLLFGYMDAIRCGAQEAEAQAEREADGSWRVAVNPDGEVGY